MNFNEYSVSNIGGKQINIAAELEKSDGDVVSKLYIYITDEEDNLHSFEMMSRGNHLDQKLDYS